jgi:hypothetical protein
VEIKGCVHVHVKGGKITNVFSHLTNLAENCVVHLTPDAIFSEEQFVQSHPQDQNELCTKPHKTVFDLGDESI